jgi:hypothetical protein
MPRRSRAIVTLATLFLTLGAIGPAAGAAQKTTRTDAPALSTKFRERLADKQKAAAKKAPARLDGPVLATPVERSRAFAARGEAGAAKTAPPSKGTPHFDPMANPVRVAPSATKTRGLPFVGRNGTGLGDIFEVEPNDDTAQTLDDLPVNVVAHIDEAGDVDCYAITATGDESIRIEVVADRIFGSSLDSFLEVLDADGTTVLASNDDFFDNSRDSFVRFIAPHSGENLYFICVSDFGGLGGSDFGYVLNVTVAETPDIVEQEPNDTTGNADIFTIPGVAFGTADFADDLDVYTFQASGNQSLIVDVDAEVFASLMDPVVELYDDRGGFLFGLDDTDGLDPRFNIVLPYTGTYYVAVYNRESVGGDAYYYSLNLSLQSAALAPRVTSFKIVNGQFLKRVIGNGFTSSDGGSYAEIDSEAVNSGPAPRKPTTRVKIAPPQSVVRGDVVTVVNPDGRRSNPGIVN